MDNATNEESVPVDDAGNEPASGDSNTTLIEYAGTPVTLASSVLSLDLAKDGSYIFYTTPDSVMRVPSLGGTSVKMVGSLKSVTGLAIDSTNLYWAESGNSVDPHCYIKKMPKTGGTITKLYVGTPGCSSLAIDATRVYWTNSSSGMVRWIGKGGSGLDSTFVGGNPQEIAVDSDGDVVWINPVRGAIEVSDLDGGFWTLARGQAPTELRLAGGEAYWTNFDYGTVTKGAVEPDADVWTLASNQAGPAGLDVYGGLVYWTNSVGGALMRASTYPGTASPSKVATVQTGADKMIVRFRASNTPPSIYWVNPSAKKVMKVNQY